ncbi:MAG: S9 family peptidase [Pseudomonadota bacterium]
MRKVVLLIRTMMFVGVAPVATAQQPMTLEDIIALQRVTKVALSPDGSEIAYLKSVPRTVYVDDDGPAYSELHVVDTQGRSRPYVTGASQVSDVAWAPDGESLLFLDKRDPDALTNTLYEIALAGGEAQSLYTHVSNISAVYPSPDGARLAFTAADAPPVSQELLTLKGFKAQVYEESVPRTHVWLLDRDSGKAERQNLVGSASTFAWSTDGKRYAVALAPTPLVDDGYTSRDVYVFQTGSTRAQAKLGSVGKLGAFAFSPDGERIAYIGSTDRNDPRDGRLYVSSVRGGERRELVPEYAGHVTDFIWRDDASVSWLGARNVATQWATAQILAPTPAPPARGGHIVRAINGRPGIRAVAAIADSPKHPGEVFLLVDGQPPKRLTDSNPWLADRELAVQEPIRYKARDGLELDAVLVHPMRKQRGGNPLIVMAHGGPEAHFSNGWLSNYSKPAQALAAAGYAVVFPNYRGSTGRGVEFSKLSQNDYADEEFNDLVDAKRHLVATGLVDADRVGITGGSYGGYASMWSASALTEEYAAAVAFVGISNQVSKFGTGDIPQEMYNVHSRAWPWDDWLGLLKRSPIYHAGKTRTPLLIMHGDADPRVHPSQSLEMYRNVKLRTDTPVRLVFYPGEGHGNRGTAAQYDYGLRMMRWMNHYLLGEGGEPPPYQIDHAGRLDSEASQ